MANVFGLVGLASVCASLMVVGSSAADASTASAATRPLLPDPTHVAVTAGNWFGVGAESKTMGRCAPSDVLVGRLHRGDENASTSLRCAWLESNGVRLFPTSSKTTSAWIKESDGTAFTCPANMMLYQRMHFNDENGQTQYRCTTMGAEYWGNEHPWGDGQYGAVTESHEWSEWVKESNHSFSCEERRVLTGRQHFGDENGLTRYQCASLTLRKVPSQIGPHHD